MKQGSSQIVELATVITFLLTVAIATTSTASGGTEERVCNVAADYMLGLENYPAAIRLHQQVLARQPHNALAHYHLGFAYGMIGHTQDEIGEYVAAANLGLTDWDLFLNLGLAYLEQGNSAKSIEALQQAVLHGPAQYETHFNLGIVYERTGRLADALREVTAALSLHSTDPEVQNMHAIVEAELGDFRVAREEWSNLIRTVPDYAPARRNLITLDAMSFGALDNSIRFMAGTNRPKPRPMECYRRFSPDTDY